MAEKKPKVETNEIASVDRDMEIFSGFLNVLQNPDKVLRLECGGDISVYDDISRDPRVASVLRTRSLSVVGKEWEIVPYSDSAEDMKIADFVKNVFLSFPFDLARRAILRGGILKGYAVSEIMWEVSEGSVFISKMIPRAQRRFRYDNNFDLRMFTQDDMVEGENLTSRYPRKFQQFVFGDEPETPYGVGLGRELYWPWWFKKNGIKFWLIFCDKFGAPTVLGKYPKNATPTQKEVLLEATQAVQTDSGIIIPDGMSLELMEAARSGNISAYEQLANFMNSEIAISVLGQTATTQGTPGKLGNDTAQENVREDLIKADADALCEALNYQVLRWVVDYNFPGVGRYPKMWIRCESEKDLKPLAERDAILSRLVAIPTSYFYETYGIPKPEEGDATVSPQSEVGKLYEYHLKYGTVTINDIRDKLGLEKVSGGDKLLPSIAQESGQAGAAEFAEGEPFTPEQQALEDLAEEVVTLAADSLAGNEEQIIKTLQQATSFDDALVALLELYPELQVDELEDLIGRAMFNSEMHGRHTAVTETA